MTPAMIHLPPAPYQLRVGFDLDLKGEWELTAVLPWRKGSVESLEEASKLIAFERPPPGFAIADGTIEFREDGVYIRRLAREMT